MREGVGEGKGEPPPGQWGALFYGVSSGKVPDENVPEKLLARIMHCTLPV